MKFQLDPQNFSEALMIVSRAVASKGIRPALANLFFSVASGELRLVGTDLEIMIISRIPAQVDEGGFFTIPARLITEIITSISSDINDTLLFESSPDRENILQFSCGRYNNMLQIYGSDDYPPVPSLDTEQYPKFEMNAGILEQALREVAIAMNTEEGNPSQKSICLNFTGDGELKLVSTDSKRLAYTALNGLLYPEDFKRVFLLSARAIPEMIKLLAESDKVVVGLFCQQLLFSTPRFQLLSRLIDGKFPDYRKVLPTKFNHRLTLTKHDFAHALKAVMPIARLGSSIIRLDISDEKIRVWSESSEQGMSEVLIKGKLEGEPISIAFNAKFLLDFLGVIQEDDVVLEMTTPAFPGVLKPSGDVSPFTYVVMPITF